MSALMLKVGRFHCVPILREAEGQNYVGGKALEAVRAC